MNKEQLLILLLNFYDMGFRKGASIVQSLYREYEDVFRNEWKRELEKSKKSLKKQIIERWKKESKK